jgi:hypothetical protein
METMAGRNGGLAAMAGGVAFAILYTLDNLGFAGVVPALRVLSEKH